MKCDLVRCAHYLASYYTSINRVTFNVNPLLCHVILNNIAKQLLQGQNILECNLNSSISGRHRTENSSAQETKVAKVEIRFPIVDC